MKIKKIKIDNFRLLKDFELELEDELSLVIGKNNNGKTSLLTVLDKFINQSERNKFTLDDFNVEFKKELIELVKSSDPIEKDTFENKGIKLKLFIEYGEKDDLSNINRVMMDLDPTNNYIVLGFEFIVDYDKLIQLKLDYIDFVSKENEKKSKNKDYQEKDIEVFLNRNIFEYFKPFKKSISYNIITDEANEKEFIDLDKEKISIKEIINFKFISAKREVSNKEVNKTLSLQTSEIYESFGLSEEQKKQIEEFKDKLSDTDLSLTDTYSNLFKDIKDKVAKFGGIAKDDSIINIVSTLQHKELLKGNTTVMYNHHGAHLPEYYNGLGYMNLLSMIFEIEILVQEFKKSKTEKPSDINLLVIEEPEAHTHPQMQYVFIKNIKSLLKEGITREDGIKRELQYIISTHSSHIVSESDYSDIKYLKKESLNSVIAKNLKALEKEYEEDGEENNYRFLKQYLTLNRAEIFFADKAILIEGDTERILLPAFMKKLDQEQKDNPLLSQNISIIEVGAYSHIFEKFISFIGLSKSLIITDIDSYYKAPKLNGTTPVLNGDGSPKMDTHKCPANDTKATNTSNSSLAFFHNRKTDLIYYRELKQDWKVLRKNKLKKWVSNRKGNLLIVYQTEEKGYHARSFEDSFFHLNEVFIKDGTNTFNSLTPKWLDKFRTYTIRVFEFAESAVGSKPSLAIEILMNSKESSDGNLYSNWEIPQYIKEGLLWLKAN